MKVGINLKIDVTKIDKARLYKGQKGTYLDAQVFVDVDEADQYGNNGMITQAVSKEERAAGEKGAILGNCKVFWRDQAQQQAQPYKSDNPSTQPAHGGGMDDDIPFAAVHSVFG